MWLAELPVATVPSPKSHAKVYGGVPPDPAPANVVICPVVGLEGLTVKPAVTDGPVALHADTG